MLKNRKGKTCQKSMCFLNFHILLDSISILLLSSAFRFTHWTCRPKLLCSRCIAPWFFAVLNDELLQTQVQYRNRCACNKLKAKQVKAITNSRYRVPCSHVTCYQNVLGIKMHHYLCTLQVVTMLMCTCVHNSMGMYIRVFLNACINACLENPVTVFTLV